MKFKAQIMNEDDVNRVLVRMAHQIVEKNHDAGNLCLVGVKTRGSPLARRIARHIREIDGSDIGVGELPIKATYVGKNIPTALNEIVAVHLTETDGHTNVAINEK